MFKKFGQKDDKRSLGGEEVFHASTCTKDFRKCDRHMKMPISEGLLRVPKQLGSIAFLYGSFRKKGYPQIIH